MPDKADERVIAVWAGYENIPPRGPFSPIHWAQFGLAPKPGPAHSPRRYER